MEVKHATVKKQSDWSTLGDFLMYLQLNVLWDITREEEIVFVHLGSDKLLSFDF